jgi:hypothetical protein
MALQFTTSSKEAVSNGVKIMVHAPAGIGKTMQVATLPGPVLISAESGLLSLSKRNIEKIFGPNDPTITYDIPTIKIYSVQDLEEAYAWATQSSEARGFATIALDSITEIMEQILNYAKEVHKDPRQAYGDLITQGEKLIRAFRDIEGKNVYMSAKQAPFKDEMSNITKYGPMMPGSKLGPSVPYFFDELYALRVGKDNDGNDYRYFQTQPDIQYEAKCRSGALEAVEYPHLGHIINKIQQYAVAEQA